MKSFFVQLLDKRYLIEPQENKTFKVIEHGHIIGEIFLIAGDMGDEWKTKDELDEDFAAQIGELITEHNM